MLCALDVWSLGSGSGAPSLFKTLQAYNDAGHTIHFVTPVAGANIAASATAPAGRQRCAQEGPFPGLPRVRVYRVWVPSLRDFARPLPARLLWIDQKFRFATLFPVLAAQKGLQVLARERIDLLYGYEVHGVLAARLLRTLYPLPLVTRFQGTIVGPALDDPVQFLRKSEEIAALKTSADLTIMTDDGTEGDRVLARLYGHLPAKVRFWRNGLDRARLRPPTVEEYHLTRSALGIAKDQFVALTVSRLARWKRVDRVIRAAAVVRERLPSFLLLIVGDGEERRDLECLTAELGLQATVRFVGVVPQRDVVRYYHAADVFLSTNDLSNVGNPLLEAMACAKAIVTLDTGATRRLIRNGVTGLLLDAAGDSQAIAEAVLHLAANPDERARLATAARTYAERHFWTWEERLAAELREVEALVLRRQ